ncbi:hypothetical protein [Corynebacterium sp. HS2168-gen11]|uniref:hypothetical protein n=1 Tax=Corynebacterium sp. HS2168-gen11 TaxID=2974027 RepID=UPI00216AE6B1|nr:hypothetical protein [Corynebacterium sp. HS2168-gen11]MCS4535181.1 hypothetical protein [Corynebacterium sp. HS2168-gen11]
MSRDFENVALATKDLVVISHVAFPDFKVPATGLSLLVTQREQAATTLSLTLAGRMKPIAGSILLFDDLGEQRFHHIALAGVPEIDSLERNMPLRSIIREQAGWALPWYRRVPRSIEQIPTYMHYAQLTGFTDETGAPISDQRARQLKVGDLDPYQRLLFRIVLALMARPQAKLLIIDDIDQVRSMRLRKKLLATLQQLSTELPVVAVTVNTDIEDNPTAIIDLRGEQH